MQSRLADPSGSQSSAEQEHSLLCQRASPGRAVPRSVLDDSGPFREQQGSGARNTKFRFRNRLLTLDSTTITLCIGLFPWAKFRRAKGGVKAHVVLDHNDYMPAYVVHTEALRSDVSVAQDLVFNPETIVVVDRGYTDYALFGRWTKRECTS